MWPSTWRVIHDWSRRRHFSCATIYGVFIKIVYIITVPDDLNGTTVLWGLCRKTYTVQLNKLTRADVFSYGCDKMGIVLILYYLIGEFDIVTVQIQPKSSSLFLTNLSLRSQSLIHCKGLGWYFYSLQQFWQIKAIICIRKRPFCWLSIRSEQNGSYLREWIL